MFKAALSNDDSCVRQQDKEEEPLEDEPDLSKQNPGTDPYLSVFRLFTMAVPRQEAWIHMNS